MVSALDLRSIGRRFDFRLALSGNDLGQVVHTNCASVNKQYNLVPCEGFHANALVIWLPCMGPVNKGSIVEAVLQ